MKPILLMWFNLRPCVEAFGATDEQVARWRSYVPELEVIHAKSQEEFVRNISKATYIFSYHFSEPWIALATRLKWLMTPAAGKELLGAELPPRIRSTNGKFHGKIMGETAVGMLLAARRGLLPGLGLASMEHPWPEHIGGQRIIAGSHAIILGYGNIGKHIGMRLEALGVRVTGITHANLHLLDNLIPTADALFLALPATNETHHILSKARIDALPRHAVVVNVGRGNAIDEPALCDALREQRLFAAFLDVTSQEPYPATGELLHTPRCYLLPHLSASAPDYLDLAFEEWLDLYSREYKSHA